MPRNFASKTKALTEDSGPVPIFATTTQLNLYDPQSTAMLKQLYAHLKEHLVAIDGMTSQPYQPKSGKGPEGAIEQFDLRGRNFAALRLTDHYLMLYIGPTLGQADPTTWYSQQLKAMLKGKGCLKVIRPEKTDISPVLALWSEGATNWK